MSVEEVKSFVGSVPAGWRAALSPLHGIAIAIPEANIRVLLFDIVDMC